MPNFITTEKDLRYTLLRHKDNKVIGCKALFKKKKYWKDLSDVSRLDFSRNNIQRVIIIFSDRNPVFVKKSPSF